MKNLSGSVRGHLSEYFDFYFCAYLLIMHPCETMAIHFGTFDIVHPVCLFETGGLLIYCAGAIKHNYPALSSLARVILAVGLSIETVFFMRLLRPACASVNVALPLLIVVAFSIVGIIIYFSHLAKCETMKSPPVYKKVFVFVFLCYFLLSGSLMSWLLS